MWKCSCGCINVGIVTNEQSKLVCAASRHFQVEHQQVSANSLDELRLYVATRDTVNELAERKQVTQQEELFATYYNRGKVLVKDMDDTSLREHREQLRQIATEAKAQLLAADDEIRERSARKSLKDKEWLVTTDTSQSVSDAINVVEKRKARMSKMDKLKQQLIDAGLDDDTIKETIAGLERRATEKSLKTVTFKKPATEDAVIQVKTKPESTEPFDPSKLSFGK